MISPQVREEIRRETRSAMRSVMWEMRLWLFIIWLAGFVSGALAMSIVRS